jgi:hypothetical protein
VKGARGDGGGGGRGGAVVVGVGGGGDGGGGVGALGQVLFEHMTKPGANLCIAVPSGGLGHNFGAGFGPNHHHDEEEDEEEEEDDDLLRQLGELVTRFPRWIPL